MESVHLQQNQVLASNTDVFMGDTQANLDHFLYTSTATQIQNWLYIWKPFIQSTSDLQWTYPFKASTPCQHTSRLSPQPRSNLSPTSLTKLLAPNYESPRHYHSPHFAFDLFAPSLLVPPTSPIHWNNPQWRFAPPSLFLGGSAASRRQGHLCSGKSCL